MRGRILAAILASLVVLPTPLAVHRLECRLPSLSTLRGRALQAVNVTMERWTLRAVNYFLHEQDATATDISGVGVL